MSVGVLVGWVVAVGVLLGTDVLVLVRVGVLVFVLVGVFVGRWWRRECPPGGTRR